VTLVLVAGSSAIAIVFRAISGLHAWLAEQEPYQLPFDQIQLMPPPPEWYRGGAVVFLRSVRKDAMESETLSLLKFEHPRIRGAFLRNPWVEEIIRIGYPPRGLSLALRYRMPVALIQISRTEQYLVDEQATILPLEDVDLERLRQRSSVLVITGKRLAAPVDVRPGTVWRPRPGVGDVSEGNGRVKDSAALAGFLAQKSRSLAAGRPKALEFTTIIPTDEWSRGLFVVNSEGTYVLWGEAPGAESPENPSAEEKWVALRSWSEGTGTREIIPPDFWIFFKSGQGQSSVTALRPVKTTQRPELRPHDARSADPSSKSSSGAG
jgi:hypothetical protein